MTKKLLSLLLIVLLCCSLPVAISVEAAPVAGALLGTETLVFDEADLLTDAEESELTEKLLNVSHTYNAQIVIATTASTDGGNIDAFINLLYDEMKFGYGENHDGVLLLVCMECREYRILSNGFAADAITLNDIDYIGEAIVPDLSDGNYAAAFSTFISECEYYINGHLNGFPFDAGANLAIALVIGIVAGVIVALVLKGQLKSVRKQNQADVYVKSGSMQITAQHDLFLYRNLRRIKRETNSSKSSSSGSSRNVGGGSF